MNDFFCFYLHKDCKYTSIQGVNTFGYQISPTLALASAYTSPAISPFFHLCHNCHSHTKNTREGGLERMLAPSSCVNLIFLLAELQTICQSYWQRISHLEGDKYDLEWIEKCKAVEVYTIHTPWIFILGSCYILNGIFYHPNADNLKIFTCQSEWLLFIRVYLAGKYCLGCPRYLLNLPCIYFRKCCYYTYSPQIFGPFSVYRLGDFHAVRVIKPHLLC